MRWISSAVAPSTDTTSSSRRIFAAASSMRDTCWARRRSSSRLGKRRFASAHHVLRRPRQSGPAAAARRRTAAGRGRRRHGSDLRRSRSPFDGRKRRRAHRRDRRTRSSAAATSSSRRLRSSARRRSSITLPKAIRDGALPRNVARVSGFADGDLGDRDLRALSRMPRRGSAQRLARRRRSLRTPDAAFHARDGRFDGPQPDRGRRGDPCGLGHVHGRTRAPSPQAQPLAQERGRDLRRLRGKGRRRGASSTAPRRCGCSARTSACRRASGRSTGSRHTRASDDLLDWLGHRSAEESRARPWRGGSRPVSACAARGEALGIDCMPAAGQTLALD